MIIIGLFVLVSASPRQIQNLGAKGASDLFKDNGERHLRESGGQNAIILRDPAHIDSRRAWNKSREHSFARMH
jgi:hypothetical protein